MKFFNHLFLNFIASGLALWGTDHFLDVISIQSTDLKSYLKILAITVIVLGILNTFIKPLLQIMSFPFLLLTLGLFSVIINAVVFYLLTIIMPEIVVSEAWGYFVIPIFLGILNWLTHLFVPSNK